MPRSYVGGTAQPDGESIMDAPIRAIEWARAKLVGALSMHILTPILPCSVSATPSLSPTSYISSSSGIKLIFLYFNNSPLGDAKIAASYILPLSRSVKPATT